MLTGSSIRGKLILSHAAAPAGGINFTVRARNISGGNSFTQSVSMAEGNSEVAYTINVPTDATKNYRVHFDCVETLTPVCETLSDVRYYDAASGNTVNTEDAAAPLSGATSHVDIDLIVDSASLLGETCFPLISGGGGLAAICL